MTTDYRAVIQRLLDTVKPKYTDPEEIVAVARAINAARAALAQPEPVGPTDEEINALLPLGIAQFTTICGPREIRAFARAVLQRWGRPTPQPIPVSERLPGPEDCDAEGRCWWHWPVGEVWSFCSPPPYRATHWLPFHALPLPRQPAADATAP